ncbi:uncharacterized protein BP5553_03929 [Venustampulla echinocandica]|uniref:Adenosine deaminase domain-containing protein n=1 Tax=Venustampulla echinocandica TaxID=2656787 RepID=A0A370TVQ2_9HELO|nr:uncharacterized protein BP5553_03929 [Venustampulla echinocandica]RDL39589.1 hypothetical protein BP5553_03929 [Venustampulla echinocandica]
MGVFCSVVDKARDEPSEGKTHAQLHPRPPRRLLKMPRIERPSTRSQQRWRAALTPREFDDTAAYDKARGDLLSTEADRAFDAEATLFSTKTEQEAAALVRKIRDYDWFETYGRSHDAQGHPTGKRVERGEHFLGNVDTIDKTELIRVARRMPKGAHLHIHFNSCLPAKFLIQQARDIDAMYIRSTIPLTTQENFAKSRISFMVMTKHEATHPRNTAGDKAYHPLGNVWEEDYICNTWMPYKDFQRHFKFVEENGHELEGTSGAEAWLERKMIISEEEAHGTHQTGHGIWERFNYRTQMMKGLFAYESAFRNYTRACIKDFVKDNIQYAEIRPNFMSTNSLKTDDGENSIGNAGIMKIIDEELQATMKQIRESGDYFGGMKVIYCTPRSFHKEQIQTALDECIDLKKKYKTLLCGFDLVGHEEMGNELRHFVPEFLEFRKNCRAQNLDIPFLFHCGETLDVGTKVDGNLFDAVLLNAKRIGHGYGIARHPLLMEIFKERKIAIESCPISNEVLGLTPTIAGHHLPILLANDVPCTINSDNATFYRSSLSHDFYQVMIGADSMSLYGWKQLAMWSLEHSCMEPEQLADVTEEWTRRWQDFCEWIIEEYGPKLAKWEPATDSN